MGLTKKRDGFAGQRAIVIPPKILQRHCETHPVIRMLYVTDIGYYPNALYHHRHRPGGINQHILIYCVKGSGWMRTGNKKYNVSPGESILLPAFTAHEYAADEKNPWTIYWLHFRGTNGQDFTNMMLLRMGGHVGSISFQENRLHLFEEIYTNVERGYSADNLCYASLALQYFLGSCCFDGNYNRLHNHDSKDNITLCVDYLQKHLDKNLTLQEIAAAVNLSVSHFSGMFKKSTGFSVIEYFNHLKMQKACQFLQFTDLRVNEIANRLGMEDPYYFSRLFSKVIGMSPKQYRGRRR